MPAPVVDPGLGPHNIGFIILAMAVELRKQQIHTTRIGGYFVNTLWLYVYLIKNVVLRPPLFNNILFYSISRTGTII